MGPQREMVNLAFALLLLSAASARGARAAEDDFEAPWYYHGLEGPEFEWLNGTYGNTTVSSRAYFSQRWTSTEVKSTSYEDAVDEAFGRLFDYISGKNADGVAIDMTCPVLTKVTPGAGPNCASNFKVSFFVPYLYQGDEEPPAPSAEDVFTEYIDPGMVAVADWDEFATDESIVAEARALIDTLDEAGIEHPGEVYWVAGYDPPFRLTHLHSEVWVPVVLAAEEAPAQAALEALEA